MIDWIIDTPPDTAPDKVNLSRVAQRLRFRASLTECAEELAEWVESHYADTKHYPSELRRYERDMSAVRRARAVLEEKNIPE